jgi:hypothetical protein
MNVPSRSSTTATPAASHHRADVLPEALAGVDVAGGEAAGGEAAGVSGVADVVAVAGVVAVAEVVAGLAPPVEALVAVNENLPLTG